MEWLKELIESAAKNQDGSLNIDHLMRQINAEFPKNAIPKSKFNETRKQLKTANQMIKDLKEEAVSMIRTSALKDELIRAGALDAEYLIYRQGGLDKFSFDEANKPVGVEHIVKSLKEDRVLKHLFQTKEQDKILHCYYCIGKTGGDFVD